MARSALCALLALGLVACGGDDERSDDDGQGGRPSTGGAQGSGGSSQAGSGGRGGESSGGSAGSAGTGGASESCAEAATCCSEIPSDQQAACQLAVDTNDSLTCAAAVLSYQSQGYCLGEDEDPTGGLPPVTLDGEWEAAISVASGTEDYGEFPIQACGDGDVVGAWMPESDYAQVIAGRFSGGSNEWNAVTVLNENNGLYAGRPRVAVNESCEATVLWTEGLDVIGGDDEYTLTASQFDPESASWGAPLVLQELFEFNLAETTYFVDADGVTELGFGTGAAGPSTVYRQTVEASAQDRVALSSLRVSGASFGLLPSGEGLFFVAEYDYYQAFPVDHFLRAYTRSPAGEWSNATDLDTLQDISHHRISVIPAGDRFYLAWNEGSEPHFAVQAPGEALVELELPPDFVLDGWAFAGHGDTLFAYASVDGQAQALRYTSEDGWADPAVISAEIHENASWFKLVVDGAGRAVAVYYQSDAGIFANRFTPEEGWSGPHAIDIHGEEPSLTADAAGRVFVGYRVWEVTGFLSGTTNLYLRRFMPEDLL